MTLTPHDVNHARAEVAAAADLAVRHKDEIHYTQDAYLRWVGIRAHLHASKGHFPHYADCSSFVTWCLWQVLEGGPDVVNRQRWAMGYTGTMAQNGSVIHHPDDFRTGDAVEYGAPGSIPFHTAIIIGRKNGMPVVASHGEESGPYVLPWDAWQVHSVRRYITAHTLEQAGYRVA